MTKLLGCTMILAAWGLFLRSRLRERTILLRTVRELVVAMERIGTAIRWQELPLPQAVAAQTVGQYTGLLFQKIAEEVKGDLPLQGGWNKSFSNLNEPLRDILCDLQLQGDREHLLRQFDRAAQALTSYEASLRAVEQDKRKLLCTTSLAGACVLIVLLL